MAEKDKKVHKSEASRLSTFYKKEIVPVMMKEFGYKNINQVPKIDKIMLSQCAGDIKDNAKSMQIATDELAQITGQKPATVLAKRSLANFKLREGMRLGSKVTMRGQRAYHFLDRLISIALPRVRDFRGVKKAFDGRGNFAMGIKSQDIFPEISYEKIEKARGFDVIVVTTAKTDKEAERLLVLFGMPFAQGGKN